MPSHPVLQSSNTSIEQTQAINTGDAVAGNSFCVAAVDGGRGLAHLLPTQSETCTISNAATTSSQTKQDDDLASSASESEQAQSSASPASNAQVATSDSDPSHDTCKSASSVDDLANYDLSEDDAIEASASGSFVLSKHQIAFQMGRSIVKVKGNGNCGYNALEAGLRACGREDDGDYDELRQKSAREIDRWDSERLSFVPDAVANEPLDVKKARVVAKVQQNGKPMNLSQGSSLNAL